MGKKNSKKERKTREKKTEWVLGRQRKLALTAGKRPLVTANNYRIYS